MPRDVKEIAVFADGVVWMAVAGNVQLALRHPENNGPSSRLARQFVDHLLGRLRDMGVISGDEFAAIMRDEMQNGR